MWACFRTIDIYPIYWALCLYGLIMGLPKANSILNIFFLSRVYSYDLIFMKNFFHFQVCEQNDEEMEIITFSRQ